VLHILTKIAKQGEKMPFEGSKRGQKVPINQQIKVKQQFKVFLMTTWDTQSHQVSISSTFYVQLLHW